MKEVSCRVFDVLFREARRRGIPVHALTSGTPHDVTHLRNRHERVEWSTYLRVMENAEALWGREEFIVLGKSFISKNPLARPFMLVGRLLFTPKEFYLWLNEKNVGMGNQMFTCIDGTARDLGPRRIEMELTMHEGYPPCPGFFYVVLGCFSEIPRLLALEAAKVEMTMTPRGARYDIRIPAGGGRLRWLRKTVAYPLSLVAVARELKEANEALTTRYHELDRARMQLDRQATQLKTAHTISKVIHGDLDLERTVDAIARALTEIAHFAAVEIEIDVTLEDHPISCRSARGEKPERVTKIALPLSSRGKEIGKLRLWPASDADFAAPRELLEYVVPTITMAIDNALAFTLVKDYHANLERRVADRTEELKQARDRLSETVNGLEAAQATRDKIFANINHEIRTPLSLIMLTVQQMRRTNSAQTPGGLAGETPRGGNVQTMEERLSGIEHNVRRLLELVDGMLLLAARQEGKLGIKPAPCDLASAVRALVSAWKPAAAQEDLALRYEGPESCVTRVDRAAIERVLVNLVANAIKFTEDGEIVVRLVDRPDELEVTVTDTGIGIAEEFRSRIFRRFEQGKPSVRPGARGSGIGLAIVKELIEAHQGTVGVEARPEGGSIFRIRLPRRLELLPTKEPQAIAPEVLPLRSTPGATESRTLQPERSARATILVAEDETELLEAFGRILLEEQYRVLLAPDGKEALRLAVEHHPDLLVSDVGMPGIDGLELTRRFRQATGNRLAPVLLVTAYGGLNERLAGFGAGAIDYVLKPFDPAELVARVRSLLEMRDLALRLHEAEQLAALTTLSAGLAHEIRNPANVVVNAVAPLRELLPSEMLTPGSPVADLMNVLDECAKHVVHLANQLIGHAHRGDLQMSLERFDAILTRALTLVGPAMDTVELTKAAFFHDPILCAGPFLVQVVANLLQNAAEAAGPGGSVKVATFREGSRFVLEVSDSGPGVPPELRQRIFEPFFTTKPPGKGTGLGLVTARQIAEKHGGTLKVVEGPTGSLFRLELPISTEMPRSSRTLIPQTNSSTREG